MKIVVLGWCPVCVPRELGGCKIRPIIFMQRRSILWVVICCLGAGCAKNLLGAKVHANISKDSAEGFEGLPL